MDKFKFTLMVAMSALCISASAGYAPTLVQDSLKRLYPQIETVGWSTDDYFYVASFQDKGFKTKVWFDTHGHWVMKQTDWQTMDQVPMPVYHTFTFGSLYGCVSPNCSFAIPISFVVRMRSLRTLGRNNVAGNL